MKSSKLLIYTLSGVMMFPVAMLTGCSLFQDQTETKVIRVTEGDGRAIVEQPANSPANSSKKESKVVRVPKTTGDSSTAQAGKSGKSSKAADKKTDKKDKNKKDKKNKKNNKIRVTAQEANKGTTQTVKLTEAEMNSSLKNLLGEWTVESVGSLTIPVTDEMPYVTFGGDGKFYSSNGCNVLNGSYGLSGDRIKFSNVLSTMRYCSGLDYDIRINSIINSDKSVQIKMKRIGQDSYLYFLNTSGNVEMTCRRHNMEYLNGLWQIVSVNGQRLDNEDINIFFDVNELKLHGNTGCNFFNGDIYIDPSRSNAIDLSNMAVTRMACPNAEIENAILLALEQVTTALNNRAGEVLLLDNSDKEIITLRKLEISE